MWCLWWLSVFLRMYWLSLDGVCYMLIHISGRGVVWVMPVNEMCGEIYMYSWCVHLWSGGSRGVLTCSYVAVVGADSILGMRSRCISLVVSCVRISLV
jgi:hypothetical protein